MERFASIRKLKNYLAQGTRVLGPSFIVDPGTTLSTPYGNGVAARGYSGAKKRNWRKDFGMTVRGPDEEYETVRGGNEVAIRTLPSNVCTPTLQSSVYSTRLIFTPFFFACSTVGV